MGYLPFIGRRSNILRFSTVIYVYSRLGSCGDQLYYMVGIIKKVFNLMKFNTSSIPSMDNRMIQCFVELKIHQLQFSIILSNLNAMNSCTYIIIHCPTFVVFKWFTHTICFSLHSSLGWLTSSVYSGVFFLLATG